MPKSKRTRTNVLAQTDRKGHKLKQAVIENIRASVDEYECVYLFSYRNMRANFFKKIRADWTDSRFFLGKNKVTRVALGKGKRDEYRKDLHKLANMLVSNVGLLMTKRSDKEVREYFAAVEERDYARQGCVSDVDFTLEKAVLNQPSSKLELLKSFKLPVKMTMGRVELLADTKVAAKGKKLSTNDCKILKCFEQKAATFKVNICASWRDGEFVHFQDVITEDEAEGEDDGMMLE